MKHAFRFTDHSGTIALGLAALTLALVCAWHWTTPETVPTLATPDAGPAPRSVSTASAAPPNYYEIADWHLFGEPGDEVSTAAMAVADSVDAVALENLPPSAVALRVTGTVTSSTGAGARAVIMDDAGRQSENAIGDQLPGNIELYAIERGRVVIRRNGALEAIALPQPHELMPKRRRTAPANANPLTSTP